MKAPPFAYIRARTLAEYTRVYAAPGVMHSGFEYYRAIFQSIAQNRETAANHLSMPVLAIGGAQWPGPMIQKIVEPVAASLRTEVIPGSGHCVPEEAPEAVTRLLQEFLGKTWHNGHPARKLGNGTRAKLV